MKLLLDNFFILYTINLSVIDIISSDHTNIIKKSTENLTQLAYNKEI